MIEKALVIVVAAIVWVAIQGWIINTPKGLNRPPRLQFEEAPKRFSLRALLIAVTLGSIGVGVVVWLLR